MEWFPGACLLCAAANSGSVDICRRCREQLPTIAHGCRRCGKALPQPNAACGFCLRWRHWPIESAVIPFHYRHDAARLITRFKYHGQLAAGRSLGLLMLQALRDPKRELAMPEALLPTPLHWSKLLRRGFNQSEELARQLGRELKLPTVTRLCARVRAGEAQVGLGNDERRRNVRGAFALGDGVAPKRVALIDDVLTSGATAYEIASALARRGVAVQLWCLACTE